MNDELSVIVGGNRLFGWTSIRVSRSIERMPSDFEIEMTEIYPDQAAKFVVIPGDACKVLLGDDVVLTGYVDSYNPRLSAGGHSIRVAGRSRCSDLVDASAEWANRQFSNQSAASIASALAFNFGIAVNSVPEGQEIVPQINMPWGETSYAVIEEVCRYRGLLAYDDVDGNLVLARAASIRSSSGLEEGVNVQEASIEFRVDQRFSSYVVHSTSLDVYADAALYDVPDGQASDPGITRHRVLHIVNEAGSTGFDQNQQRAEWEYRRRAGRSSQLHVITDGWRDQDGVLWSPNTLVALNLPSMSIVDKSWLIADVTYLRDEQRGTCCELRIMPSEAFVLPPPRLPGFADVRKAMAGTPLGLDVQNSDAAATSPTGN